MGPKGNMVKRKAAKAKAKAKARQKKKMKDHRDEYSDDESHSRDYYSESHGAPVYDDEEEEEEEEDEHEDGEEYDDEDDESVSLTAADIYKTLPELLANNPRAHEYFNDLRDYILRAEKEFFKNHPGGSKKSPVEALYESLDKISLEDIETLKQHIPSIVEEFDEERDAPIIPNRETKTDMRRKEKEENETNKPMPPVVSSDSEPESDDDVETPLTENGELDVDALLRKYDVKIKKSEDDSSYLSMEMDNDEFVQLQTTHMTEKEIMSTRYKMGEALSRNQFEKSFQVLQQELDDYELRDVLSEFYYELVRLYCTQEDQRIDLTELLERCTYDQITDDFIKRYEDSRRTKEEAKPSTSKDLDAIKDDDKTEDANANIEIGMYGWGCLLQAELHRRRVFREMLFWFKTKLAASRTEGTLAAAKYLTTKF
ncbi:hypothetical protein TRICI_005956 [Trichomonascus ciferrii]|uniref:Uncharacterized protein n=1 Tax=Trichomonascus ciferrii TaxID=44093 RepID=A0A642UUE3_9ASCO|nr:hypothetical protein TRICI_005956 [Trichomonascus ciferrii]